MREREKQIKKQRKNERENDMAQHNKWDHSIQTATFN